ncbi:hypothetical protein VHEMI08439 [[Torrubiella] hemipterigena]|uniref:Aspergillopepsin-2 n=1 Tax=[Torrubiella] hemipterigena TaxID=1531966 RepID=A0A0A1TDI2_9HYPO|nr:hypothetical protein VHEMI08439 [[Torrubiella] hemipterigena]
MKYTTVLAALCGIAAAANPRGTKLRHRNVLERSQVSRAPSSRVNQRIPNPNKSIASPNDYSSNWSGAVQNASGITKITGTMTVPSVSGGSQYGACAWVGIDGDSCQSALLQTGLFFYGDGTFQAFYEWIPDNASFWDNFGISVGDQVRFTVDATSTATGTALVENLTTGQSVNYQWSNPPSTLCEANAEWIVEDFSEGGSLVPFANYGSITFSNAVATTSSGSVTPAGAKIYDIQGKSTCSISGDDVTCNYIGS